MGSKNKKVNWMLPNGNNLNFSKSTNNAQRTKTFASKPKTKKKARWNYVINKVRENPPAKEKLYFITIAIAFLSIVLITTGTVVGDYWMSWIEPGNNANVNNEYLIALTTSFFLAGITITSFKRPSGLFLVWFGVLFATITTGMEEFYLGLTTGIILLPIIVFVFIEWQDINFIKKANNSKIIQFNLWLPA